MRGCINSLLVQLNKISQRDPEYLLMAKIGKYKLWDKSFVSLIIDGSWVSDEVDITFSVELLALFVSHLPNLYTWYK